MPAALEDVTIDRRLLALPYRIEVTREGCLFMTPLEEPALTWEQLATTHPIFPDDLHWKLETNARHQILMSPPPNLGHQEYGGVIFLLLSQLMKDGHPVYEAGVKTRDGTKIPDVIWVSSESRAKSKGRPSLPSCPELCVEILSPSNTKLEIEQKKSLYFEGGAQEVWICDRKGKMTFYARSGLLRKSRLCPGFPGQINPRD